MRGRSLDWGNDYLADNEAVIIQKLKDGGTVITELTEEQKAEFRRPAPESMMIMQICGTGCNRLVYRRL